MEELWEVTYERNPIWQHWGPTPFASSLGLNCTIASDDPGCEDSDGERGDEKCRDYGEIPLAVHALGLSHIIFLRPMS